MYYTKGAYYAKDDLRKGVAPAKKEAEKTAPVKSGNGAKKRTETKKKKAAKKGAAPKKGTRKRS